mgnify:CR=1 FL=1
MSVAWDRSGWPNFKSLQRAQDFDFILEIADELKDFGTIKDMCSHLAALRPHRSKEGWVSLMQDTRSLTPGLSLYLGLSDIEGRKTSNKSGENGRAIRAGEKKVAPGTPEHMRPKGRVKSIPNPTPHEDADGNDWLTGSPYVYQEDTDMYYTFLRAAGDTIQVPGATHRQMKDAYSNMVSKGATINEVCREFGMPRNWFDEYRRKHGWTHDMDPFTDEELKQAPDVEHLVDDLVLRRRQQLHKKHEARKWKDTEEAAEKWFNFETSVMDNFRGLLSEWHDEAPPRIEMVLPDKPYALVVSPTDFHWGKFAWRDETGNDYNFDEAKKRLMETTTDLISRLPGRPEKVFIATGSDWFHIDNPGKTTTRGTPQDIFGSPSQILLSGCRLARQHIEMFRQVAPIEVLFMPGNHDQYSTLTMMLYLQAVYEDVEDVNIIVSPMSRQYIRYGATLMGFTHGDRLKPEKLPQLMAIEKREDWGICDHRLWFTGHVHHQQVKETGGALVIKLPSLSGTDKWHFDMGYTTARPGLMGHLVDERSGMVGSLFCPIHSNTA